MAPAAVVLRAPAGRGVGETRPPAPAPGACVLCHDPSFPTAPAVPATATYTDVLGFPNPLCATHHRALLAGLRRAAAFRPRYATPASRGRPQAAGRRAYEPDCTGVELRRTRQRVGWTIRRLARELGCTYGHLQASETGRTRVSPLVAAWVVRVRSPGTSLREPQPGCGYSGQEEENGALARR